MKATLYLEGPTPIGIGMRTDWPTWAMGFNWEESLQLTGFGGGAYRK
ncbi:MAG: hypothetical protein IPI77_25100 [Saprospiraceae bacterium]|nr:hypothetical protein [Saprospiraceae bacterium]